MGPKATRDAFGEVLVELGESHPEIVVLDADLSKSTRSSKFEARFPDRFFQMGIAEANMIGTGAGLALAGKKPFICSFACFLTGRYDQIRVSIAYTRAPVRIVGTHAGVAIGEDGYSQMGLEDIACMRALAGMSVFQPADEIETRQLITFLVGYDHPSYTRLTRQKMQDVHDSTYRFEFGKADLLFQSSGKIAVTIMASGGPLYNALTAGKELDKEGIGVRVYNFHTIKPIDAETVAREARQVGRIITVEDHNVLGGFGSAVCEAASAEAPALIKRLGMQDVFGESGKPAELYEKFGMSARAIHEAAKQLAHR